MNRDRKAYGLDRLRDSFQVSEPTAKSMRANRSVETKPERRLRKALWAAGLRGYRKNLRGLPGSPDIVYSKAKICIFVHGCFWHGCTKCSRNLKPKKNAKYWAEKIKRNRERDARNRKTLVDDGWLVMTIWECELKNGLGQFVEVLRRHLAERRISEGSTAEQGTPLG